MMWEAVESVAAAELHSKHPARRSGHQDTLPSRLQMHEFKQ